MTATATAVAAPPDLATAREAPGPKGWPLVGSAGEFRANPLALLTRSIQQHGDVVKLNLVRTAYIVNHPDGVRRVLHDHHLNYKKNFVYDRLKSMLGEGLLTSSGDLWKRQRKLAQPAFHRQRIKGFADLMATHTARMLERWRSLAASRKAFDAHHEMMRLTFSIIGDALFSLNLEGGAAAVGQALHDALGISQRRFTAFFIPPKQLPTPDNRRFAAAMKVLDDVVEEIIQTRRAASDLGSDLLGMLMAARDEVMTMVLAGHETTANALSWVFYLLSKNPAVARRVQQEAREVLQGRAPTMEDIPNLRYTQQVIEESMRLYPPAWIIGREALEDDVVQGLRIPKGSSVLLVPFTTHRHKDFWENPEGFDPDRFTPELSQKRHRYAYFPFAAGPRMCIGDGFAKMEMPIILAMVSQRYALHLEPGFVPELDPVVTLRPGNGIQVTAKELVA